MHRNRNQLREEFYLTGDRIDDLLRSAKTVLSARQYKELRRSVNQTVGYAEQRGLIFASVQAAAFKSWRCTPSPSVSILSRTQAKAQKKRGESRQDA